MNENDRFIAPSIHQILGPAPLASLSFGYAYETNITTTLRMRATNIRKKGATFALVVANAAEGVSEAAQAETTGLRFLFERAGDFVARTWLSGFVFLPDRRGREEMGRDLFVCVREWLSDYHALGITEEGQFVAAGASRATLSRNDTEQVKTLIVEMAARFYDHRDGVALDMPSLEDSALWARQNPNGKFDLKLASSARVLRRVVPAHFIHDLVSQAWRAPGGQPAQLIPADLESFVAALQRGARSSASLAWIREYINAVRAGKYPERPWFPIDELAPLAGTP